MHASIWSSRTTAFIAFIEFMTNGKLRFSRELCVCMLWTCIMWSDDGFWVPRAAPGYRFMPPNKRKKSIQNYRLLRHSMIMAHPCWFIKASKCGPQLFGIVSRVAVCSMNCERLSRLIDGEGAKGAVQKFLTRSIVFFPSHFPCQATNATQLAIGGNLLLSAEIAAMSFVWISHSVQVNLVFLSNAAYFWYYWSSTNVSIIEATKSYP